MKPGGYKTPKHSKYDGKPSKTKTKVASVVRFPTTLIVEKIKFAEDFVYYKLPDDPTVHKIEYSQFVQAYKSGGMTWMTRFIKVPTGEFYAQTTSPYKNDHLVLCTRDGQPSIVLNKYSLVILPDDKKR